VLLLLVVAFHLRSVFVLYVAGWFDTDGSVEFVVLASFGSCFYCLALLCYVGSVSGCKAFGVVYLFGDYLLVVNVHLGGLHGGLRVHCFAGRVCWGFLWFWLFVLLRLVGYFVYLFGGVGRL